MSRIRAAYYDPEGTRYGIPTYGWRGAPAGYATRRQLTRGRRHPRRLPLPGRPGPAQAHRHPAQRAAIGKALTARRTCRICRQVRPYYIPRSLGECLACAFPQEDAA